MTKTATRRTFDSFLEKEGRHGVRIAAEKYATGDYSLSDLAEETGMSEYGVRKLIEYAIIRRIVDFDTALAIKAAAHNNQSQHFNPSASNTTSDFYYEVLFQKRALFIENFENEKLLEIVKYYLSNPEFSTGKIANMFGLNFVELNILLKKGVIFSIFDDNTFKALREVTLGKAVSQDKKRELEHSFKKMENARGHYAFLCSKVELYSFQIKAYRNFASSESEKELPPQLLAKELAEVKEKQRVFRDNFYRNHP